MVKHYDDGEFYVMPYSGRHTKCLCGQMMQDNHKLNEKRKTKDKSRVTCKRCLKKLEQRTTAVIKN